MVGLTVALVYRHRLGAWSSLRNQYLVFTYLLQPWGPEDSRASPLYCKQENKTQEWREEPRSLVLHFLFSIFK